ncbi:MAG: hypothetical protein PHO75_02290 [Candidatus Shapirobacteria bacterium]|nr:hypothetical protein [Candidatus Shapirobacteria bacterium]
MIKSVVKIANDKDLIKALLPYKLNKGTFQLFPSFELIYIENISYLLIIKD